MKKVLYVDDETTNLLLFEANFKNKYELHAAENGCLGLKVIDEHPDIQIIIISDMKMPHMNGIEFNELPRRKRTEYQLKNYS